MTTNRGDIPVSPTQGLDAQGLPLQEMDYGMTMREQMAMAAMQGLCANSIPGAQNRPENLAAEAVMYADALLAQLERTK